MSLRNKTQVTEWWGAFHNMVLESLREDTCSGRASPWRCGGRGQPKGIPEKDAYAAEVYVGSRRKVTEQEGRGPAGNEGWWALAVEKQIVIQMMKGKCWSILSKWLT